MDVHPTKNGIFIGIDPYPYGISCYSNTGKSHHAPNLPPPPSGDGNHTSGGMAPLGFGGATWLFFGASDVNLSHFRRGTHTQQK